jgi:hypothetical protein
MINPEQSENILDRHLHKLWLNDRLCAELGAYETPDLHVLISGVLRFKLPDEHKVDFAAWNHVIAVSLPSGKRILWTNPSGKTYQVNVKDEMTVDLISTDLTMDQVVKLLYGE